MSPIDAQNLFDRVSRFAPPLAASAVVLISDDDVAMAVVAVIAIAIVDGLLRERRFPLHLVPLARYVMALVVPATGIFFTYLLSEIGKTPIGVGTALIAFAASGLVNCAYLWLGDRFAAERPIRTAVTGSGIFADRLKAELVENRIRSYEVIGYVDERPVETEREGALPYLGSIAEIRSIVQQHHVDLLVVDPSKPRLKIFEETAKASLDLSMRMIEATALYESVLGHVPIGSINSAWFQYIMHPRYSPASPLSKRLLDIVLTLVLLVVAIPIMVLCALAILLEDGRPVTFRQPRFGEEGRAFEMIKFRTLLPDADRRLEEGTPEAELETKVGRFLRKLHFNELPQLLQVLHGEMSLVGPRPEPPELVRKLRSVVPYYDRRALVKPGLTGWAQVRCGYSGTRVGTAWKTCHDLYYVKHRSVELDLIILVQTFRALIERHDTEQMPALDFILGDTPEQIAG